MTRGAFIAAATASAVLLASCGPAGDHEEPGERTKEQTGGTGKAEAVTAERAPACRATKWQCRRAKVAALRRHIERDLFRHGGEDRLGVDVRLGSRVTTVPLRSA
jgi:hypothetical protein